MEDYTKYGSNYSESGLWDKIKKCAKKAGNEVIKNVLILYYALPNASAKDKAIIIGALGYFILPIDIIPDVIPVLGYTDDAAALLWAIKKTRDCATPEVLAKAEQKTNEWLG